MPITVAAQAATPTATSPGFSMGGVSFEAWMVPFMTFLLGVFLTQLTEGIRGLYSFLKQRGDRRALIEDRRADFQRQTLVDLQDALQAFARATGRAHHEDVMAYRQSGQWAKTPISDEWNQKLLDATGRINALWVRVLDKELRDLVVATRNASVDADMAKSDVAAEQAMRTFSESLVRAYERLGDILRTLY